MKLLCDTHAFLWWVFDDPSLSKRARALMAAPENELYLSAASGWEVATKFRLGKLPEARPLMRDMTGWVERAGFRPLAISLAHAEKAGGWSIPHRDPFDRMIAAQSLLEGVPILGCDRVLESFGVELLW